ncbi:MAG: C40 family peptidase [Lachnospiraceae bacterium]|nr:C40 family peptidase [Lachnospiraceae bacterium]
MADPATIALAVKAAVAAATDKRTWKAIAVLIAAILTPFILIIVMIVSMLSATADHNNFAIDLTFYGGSISEQVPKEYKQYIEDMRESFSELDTAVSESTPMLEEGSLDNIRMKAIFYSLFFGAENLKMNADDYRNFADCFVQYEERTRTVTDEDGNESEETYTVAIPITDLAIIYGRLEQTLGKSITEENKVNAQRIYAYAKYGKASPEGETFLPPGDAMGDGSYQALITEAEKYLGYPYVWGGSSPSTSFDCSGFVCWVYTHSGVYSLPRTTASSIYNQCVVVPRSEARPGDLIFFTKTYATTSPVSHVGIYVGDNRMIHCGNPISYTSIDTAYWRQHFYAFGRLK